VSAELVVKVECPLPASLPVGVGSAVFCCGTCFHRREEVVRLELLVDGARHRPAATHMARPDVREHEPRGFRSGFWGTVPAVGGAALALAARLTSGAEIIAPLHEIAVVQPEQPARRVEPDTIAICMATYEPDVALFHTQIDSLRAQTDRRWLCVVSDDASSPERFDALREVIGDDERFVVSRSERRLGFYRNFERALGLAPAGAELIALCDQDDRWYPDKLATLRSALGDAQMVYSDQRLVDAGGRVLRESLWEGRGNNHTNLASLLVANSVTGAACLLRREVADRALPFPDMLGIQFHDHWLGLVSLATGDVAYVPRPLYDYVQHREAVFGEVSGGRPRRGPRGLLRGGRGAYFLGYLGRAVQAQTLLLRCGDRLTPTKRRALERFVAAERSPRALAWLAARALVHRRETLASELELVHGIAWRWAVALLTRLAGEHAPRVCDAAIPDALSFEQRRLRRWRARA
jgi:glycosyltransferase involved in cell wall biosynthesis